MAGIKQSILDVKTQIASIVGEDGQPVFKRIRIWNNQVEYEKDGQLYNYPKPAAFVEVVNDAVYEELGVGVQMADTVFRIHIVHEYYDGGNDGFEEDLVVFDLRDRICEPFQNGGLSLFQPKAFGPLTKIGEAQDYEHDNIYHYTIDFKASFTDTTGSILDPENGNIIYKEPPTDGMVNVQLVDSIDGIPENTILKKNVIPAQPVYRFPIIREKR